jgi:hypothetical protein
MATLQRGRSSRQSNNTGSRNGGDGVENDAYTNSMPSNRRRSSNNNNNNNSSASSPNPIVSAWEARRRRKSGAGGSNNNNNKGQQQQTSDNYEEEEEEDDDDDDDYDQQDNNNNNNSRRRRNKNGKKKSRSSTKKSSRGKDLPDDEYDPYDSDPGESYREHCERIQGESSKTCLAMPKFLKDGKLGSSNKRGGVSGSQVGNDSSSSISNGGAGGGGGGGGGGIKTKVVNNGIDQNGNLINRNHNNNHDDKSGATSPPSPFQSELDDMSPIQQRRRRSSQNKQGGGGGGGGGGLNPNNPLGRQQQFGTPQSQQHQPDAPASLPRDLARVRYSLRTSIGDGTDVQPGGSAAMMERRDLRPNNIHINVSHWSDFGGRNYMEDRYVYYFRFIACPAFLPSLPLSYCSFVRSFVLVLLFVSLLLVPNNLSHVSPSLYTYFLSIHPFIDPTYHLPNYLPTYLPLQICN